MNGEIRMKSYSSRKDVPEKYKWDLSFLFPNNDEWEKFYNKTDNQIEKLSLFQGKINNAKTLYDYLKLDSKISVDIMDLYVYAMANSDEDLSNGDAITRLAKASDIENKYCITVSFFEPELLSLSKDDYNRLIDSSILKNYKSYLDKIYRFKDLVLTKE